MTYYSKFEEVLLTRDELYEKVWTVPTVRLAKEFGISDVALSKICRKHKIPKPPPGYWARIEAGQAPKRTPLPGLTNKDQQPELVTINKRVVHPKLRDLLAAVPEGEKFEIKVPDSLRNPHPLVKLTQKAFEEPFEDKYGLVHPRGEALDIAVAKPSVKRALRIMSGLIYALEGKGYPVAVVPQDRGDPVTTVTILGERFELKLREVVRREDHVPTEKELKENERYPWSRWRKWDFFPTRRLSISFSGRGWGVTQRKWADAKGRSLEEFLGELILSLEKSAIVAADERKSEEAHRERARQWRAEQEEKERQKQEEERRLRELESEAILWETANRLRQYISAVEDRLKAEVGQVPKESKSARWLSWARAHSDSIDPIPGKLKALMQSSQ